MVDITWSVLHYYSAMFTRLYITFRKLYYSNLASVVVYREQKTELIYVARDTPPTLSWVIDKLY